MNLFLYLLFGHYIGDYLLQTDYIAKEKGNCIHVLIAHSAIQASTVLWATNKWEFALFEFFAHMGIDKAKSKELINLSQDQMLHITCRLAYWLILFLPYLHY